MIDIGITWCHSVFQHKYPGRAPQELFFMSQYDLINRFTSQTRPMNCNAHVITKEKWSLHVSSSQLHCMSPAQCTRFYCPCTYSGVTKLLIHRWSTKIQCFQHITTSQVQRIPDKWHTDSRSLVTWHGRCGKIFATTMGINFRCDGQTNTANVCLISSDDEWCN